MPQFPVPNLVSGLRPSYFEEALNQAHYLAQFQTALKEAFPKRYAAMEMRTPRAYYLALFEECAALFPMNEFGYESVKAGWNEFYDGIPFGVFRPEPDNHDLDSPALALLFTYWDKNRGEDPFTVTPREGYRVLYRYKSEVSNWLPGSPVVSLRTYMRAPRGRRYRKPWGNLYDFITCFIGATDNSFIDTTDLEQHEMEMFPRWQKDEIEALADAWRRAKPLLDRAHELRRFVDKKPRERLPLLAGAFRRDPAIMQQITEPSREQVRVRTLARQFA